MVANRPWDGSYNVSDTIWIAAHTTQFTEIGWRYLAGAACSLLPGGGSQVALVSPTGTDVSIVIETVGANTTQIVKLQLAGKLSSVASLDRWATLDQQHVFIKQAPLKFTGGAVSVSVPPNSVLTLSTIRDAKKGEMKVNVGTQRLFASLLPYSESFDAYPDDTLAKYFSDMEGSFAVAPDAASTNSGQNKVYRQFAGVVPPKCTHGGGSAYSTVIGDRSLSGYTLEVGVRFRAKDAIGGAFAMMGSHAGATGAAQTSKRGINTNVFYDKPFIANSQAAGAVLVLKLSGNWTLTNGAQATIASGSWSPKVGAWHKVVLSVTAADAVSRSTDGRLPTASSISASVDGVSLVEKKPLGTTMRPHGAAWLGSGWHGLDFDNFSLKSDDTPAPHKMRSDDVSPCDVTHYLARGDNHTEATSAFQAAVAACAGRARGNVIVPAGTYLLRPVQLVSHTTLVIEPGATLVAWSGLGWKAGWPNSTSATCTASPYESKTPVVVPQLESLLFADGVTNVTVKGGGRLDGQGWRWWPLRDKSEYWHHCKPSLIRLGGGNSTRTSSHITIDNLALHNSPHFNIQAWTDHTRYTRINFTADTCPLNTDSLHVGGWNVYIADCNVHSGDDCVPVSKYSENVLVERVQCSCGNGASPLIWGTAHDKDAYIKNITFRDMTFTSTRFGANIKSLASYLGTLHDVVFENFVLHDVAKAINIDLKGQTDNEYDDADARTQTIRVHNVTFRNFTGDAKIAGTLTCPGNGTCSGILLQDINITGTQTGFICSGSVAGRAIRTSPPAKCLEGCSETL